MAGLVASKPLPVILDTNVWISGIFFERGAPAQLLARWRDGHFVVIVTSATLAELSEVLYRKTAQFGAPIELAAQWLEFIQAYAIQVEVETHLQGLSRDPKDDMLLEATVAGEVDFLVTGDQDLLVLGSIGSAQIISPRAFLDWLESLIADD